MLSAGGADAGGGEAVVHASRLLSLSVSRCCLAHVSPGRALRSWVGPTPVVGAASVGGGGGELTRPRLSPLLSHCLSLGEVTFQVVLACAGAVTGVGGCGERCGVGGRMERWLG